MNLKTAGQVIRDTVDMEQILSLYGYSTKHGFMVCPFHGDRDASLKVYPGTGGWHCFGCGRGGSVIDFVMEHEQCNFRTAVTAIDVHLHLHLTDAHENPEEAEREKIRQMELDNRVEMFRAFCEERKADIETKLRTDLARMKWLEELREMDPPPLGAEDYLFMLQWKEEAQYDEYRIEKIDQYMEEVAAWRRSQRRAGSA